MTKKLLITTSVALLTAACWQPPRPQAGWVARGQTEFKHETHLNAAGPDGKSRPLFCDGCHQVQPDKMYALARPGSAEHAPCDTCHAEDYKKPPGPMCGVCHEAVNPKVKGQSPLHPYPTEHRESQLVMPFNHALHLDASNAKTALECGACHAGESEGSPYMGFPAHRACAACHADEQPSGAKPAMSQCASCHDRQSPTRPRNFLDNDVRFTHAKHERDMAGAEIECRSCHQGVLESTSVSRLALPSMSRCADCHEDAARTPDAVRIAKCEVCHLDSVKAVERPIDHTARVLPSIPWGRSSFLTSLAPSLFLPLQEGLAMTQAQTERSALVESASAEAARTERPLPSTRRPEDHNAFFRVRHEAAASDLNAKCRHCHEGVSGAPVSSCQDCHAVMRPRNHTGRFSTTRHGRLAAADPKACATCHEVDYCSSCHNIAPPSHFPLERFQAQHARRASANPRSCVTCHTFDVTCSRCHESAVN